MKVEQINFKKFNSYLYRNMGEESQIRAFYAGKNFFITGGTGFVGLCLIEKILRSIPDVGKLYLLMRPKKGKEISQRVEEFPKNPVSFI